MNLKIFDKYFRHGGVIGIKFEEDICVFHVHFKFSLNMLVKILRLAYSISTSRISSCSDKHTNLISKHKPKTNRTKSRFFGSILIHKIIASSLFGYLIYFVSSDHRAYFSFLLSIIELERLDTFPLALTSYRSSSISSLEWWHPISLLEWRHTYRPAFQTPTTSPSSFRVWSFVVPFCW